METGCRLHGDTGGAGSPVMPVPYQHRFPTDARSCPLSFGMSPFPGNEGDNESRIVEDAPRPKLMFHALRVGMEVDTSWVAADFILLFPVFFFLKMNSFSDHRTVGLPRHQIDKDSISPVFQVRRDLEFKRSLDLEP
jgi:hypothetical protein